MSRFLAWRVPPFVAAWAVLAAGHALLGRGALPSAAENPCRWLAVASGLVAIWFDARTRARAAASGTFLRPRGRTAICLALALLSLIAAGASLGIEAGRLVAPLEVHPRPLRAEIRGFVADASAAGETPATLRFDVVEARVGGNEAAIDATLRLRWPVGSPAPTWCVAGTPLAARGIIRPLEDARNPGGSPPGRWLEREGIDASFEVDPGSVEPWDPPPGAAGRDRRAGARLASEARRAVGRLLDAHAPGSAAALARGMLLGDRVGIDAETRDSFRNAGTLHILSISGLHVCIVAGFVAAFARGVGLSAGIGTAIELAALAGYVAFVGAPAPALRSALLWVFARGARLAGRGAVPFAGWGAAGLLLHLADPRLPTDLGFLLSFGAVLGLEAGAAMATRSRRDAQEGWLRRIARGGATAVLAGAGAAAGTFPIEVAAFGSVPIAGPVANLVVIPLTTLFLAEAILVAILGSITPPAIGDLLGGALGAMGDLLLVANDHLGGRVAPCVIHGEPPLAAVALSYTALLAVAAVRLVREEGSERGTSRASASRLTAIALVTIAVLLPLLGTTSGLVRVRHAPRLVTLDVGQGDAAILVGANGRAIAIDAGPRSARRDEGRSTVEPALRAEGVAGRIAIVASHGHRDHEGGILGLASRGWVARVVENGGGSNDRRDWRTAVARGGGRVETAREGARRLAVPGIDVAVHAPRAGSDPAHDPRGARAGGANSAENDRSLVALATIVSDDGRRWSELFPGDVEREGEAAWLESGLGRVAVLKVPHHGSRTSSTREWVERLRPRLALVSVGDRNRHRHPSPETLRRYRAIGAWVLRTDREGAIRVTVGRSGLLVSTRAHPLPRSLEGAARSTLSPCFDFP